MTSDARNVTGWSRRRFLAASGAGLAALAIPGCAEVATPQAGTRLTSRLPLPQPFNVPLPVPQVARPADGRTHYEVTQRAADLEIIPGVRTTVWGYDGQFPGPTFDVRRGRPITVSITNRLPVPTSTHLHGGVTPWESDGYPTHLVVPGQLDGYDPAANSHMAPDPSDWRLASRSFTHEFPLDQPAATLWYHDHRMDFTGPQVYHGLAGMFVVRDDIDDRLPLPKADRDIPLLICDRAFDEDGSFLYPAVDSSLLDEPGVTGDYHQGVEGDVILVNGAPWPVLEVGATRYRFRILNAGNARRLDLRLDPAPPSGSAFTQVGSDVGLLATPLEHDSLMLAGAERMDVLIDFGAYPVGTSVTLRNALGSGGTGQVMRFDVVRPGTEDSTIPDRLADVEPLSTDMAAVRRSFDFRLSGPGRHGSNWTINGEIFSPDTVLARPQLGTVELWTLTSDFHHPVHTHLGHFQVYRRNGRPPRPTDTGWKDTVDVRPYEVVEVLVKFTGYRGRYVMHCHNLEHEDMAMMANIDVV